MSSEAEARLEFPRVKGKFYRGFAVAAVLLCASVAILFTDEGRQLKGIAAVAACCCAFYAAYCIWEIRDPSPGLVIDPQGLVLNMGGTPMNRIPWNEITGFRIHELPGHRFVVVDVVDHQKYIDQYGWPQSVAQLAAESAGSPVAFEAEPIGLAPEELLRVLSSARDSYGQ